MRRVLVIGSPGAGKSTFARELARRTGLPLTHLDAEYWRPDWVRPRVAEWEVKVRGLIAAAWILDGNYTTTALLRAARTDTVVVLDYPRTLCLYRAVRHLQPPPRHAGPRQGAAEPGIPAFHLDVSGGAAQATG